MTTIATPQLEIIPALENFIASWGLGVTHNAQNIITGVYRPDSEKHRVTEQINGIGMLVGNAAAWETMKFWVIGDLLNLGFKIAGEKFAQFKTLKTFENWARCVAWYDYHERDLVGLLDWTHFYEVYTVDKPLRAQLLRRAYDEKLTAAELRALKNASVGKSEPPRIVRGMQHLALFDALNGGFINEGELAAALESGATRCRVEYVVSFEGD